MVSTTKAYQSWQPTWYQGHREADRMRIVPVCGLAIIKHWPDARYLHWSCSKAVRVMTAVVRWSAVTFWWASQWFDDWSLDQVPQVFKGRGTIAGTPRDLIFNWPGGGAI